MLGGPGPRTDQRLARLHRIEARVGPFAVVLAYVLPVPAALIYAAVGDGGMRLGVFLALDLLGTLLWTSLLSAAGTGSAAPPSTWPKRIARYGLWATLALVVVVILQARRRAR
jgi:membrane protein DedA with SNARE-associated domain